MSATTATEPTATLDSRDQETLKTLLETPVSSLSLLSTQLASVQGDTPSALAARAIELIHTWSTEDKAAFIHGHPRIGEQSNLSALSAAEQAKYATPPEVLERLRVLNIERHLCMALIQVSSITFVAGRTRAQIVQEMEESMELKENRQPNSETPAPLGPGDEQWEAELKRAIDDIGRIANDRASKDKLGKWLQNSVTGRAVKRHDDEYFPYDE
ncbi:10402_t:CDS:2 [Acaulospora colombiana]|uniref:10402_t:CDS:1 n=1 Tax=Acaulospora colombiana TaxID=27376 RepID=A0ACA9MKV8_9GLOM|nr:10402_t:CDS:2 [Acaulospora colombiana]